MLVTFYLLLVTRCRFARCSLLIVKSFVIHCKISSLLVAEMARFKKSLYTHYKIHSFLIAEIASCKKFFVTRFENHLCY